MPLDLTEYVGGFDAYTPWNIPAPSLAEEVGGTSIWSRISGGVTEGVTNVFNKVNNSFASGFQQDKIVNSITDVLNSGIVAAAQQVGRGIFSGFGNFGENFRRSATAGFLGTKTGQEISADATRAQLGSWLMNPMVLLIGGVVVVLVLFSVMRR